MLDTAITVSPQSTPWHASSACRSPRAFADLVLAQLRAIPFKNAVEDRQSATSDKPEIDASVCVTPNRHVRNSALVIMLLLLFLYNSWSASRRGSLFADPANLADGHLAVCSYPGQGATSGGSARCGPGDDSSALRPLMARRETPRAMSSAVSTGEPMTRFGVHRVVTVQRCRRPQATRVESMVEQAASAHTRFRHNDGRPSASRSGVDINTIRAWLGHVSVDTTQHLCRGRSGDEGQGACQRRHRRAAGTKANPAARTE